MNKFWQSLVGSLDQVSARFVNAAQHIVGALVILLLGLLLAAILRKVVSNLLRRLSVDKLAAKVGLDQALAQVNVSAPVSDLFGRLTFWFVLLFAGLSAADTMGLEQVSRSMDVIINYLPNVFGAGIILVAGLTLARVGKQLLATFLGRLYGHPPELVVRGFHAVMIFVVVGLVLSQLKIETDLLELVTGVVLGAACLALALSIGLGSQRVASNVLAGIYTRKSIHPGMVVDVGGQKGEVVEVATVHTRLRAETGEEFLVPNDKFSSAIVAVAAAAQEADRQSDKTGS